jgi:hypothetical protein
MAERKSGWGFAVGLGVVVLVMIAASVIFQQQQQIDRLESSRAAAQNSRNQCVQSCQYAATSRDGYEANYQRSECARRC